jgi:hypothetical protein
MAERLAPGDYDQLHHFVAAGVWDALYVLVLRRDMRLIDGLARLDEKTGLVDLESVAMCSPNEPVLGPFFRSETLFLHNGHRLVAGKLAPIRPSQFLIGKERLKFLRAFFCGAFCILLALIKLLEENQV